MSDYVAAVIGAGRIGLQLEVDPKRIKPATHAGMWTACPRTRLAAVCDADAHARAAAKTRYPDAAVYRCADTMLREVRPHVVSIAAHAAVHPSLIVAAARHGARLAVCEKPVGTDRAAVEDALETAARCGTTVIVNHARRFDPLLRQLKADLDRGLIGRIRQIQAVYVHGLMATGTHAIDLFRMLLKDTAGEIVWASGHVNATQPTAPTEDPCHDAMFGFADGTAVAIQSLDIRDYDVFEVHMFGSRGKLAYRNIGRDIEVHTPIPSPQHEGFTELSPVPCERRGGRAPDYFSHLCENALAVLDGTAAPLCTGEDGLAALHILEAVRQSARGGGARIPIVPVPVRQPPGPTH